MAGRIVILNGAPRSGKSTLARAVQTGLSGQWINWGVDAFNATIPASLLPGIGLRPGGERPDLEDAIGRLYRSYFAHMATLARQGFDVVADLGLHHDYDGDLDPLAILAEELGDLAPLLVGVDCAIEIIMARRNADPRGGLYLGGSDIPAPVRRWQVAVHEGMDYALRLDMGVLTPQEGAEALARAVHENDSNRHI